jgi:drug/metabolite transporter (DMT)-like permease
MLISALLVAMLHVAVRHVSADIPAFQSAFFRSLFAFLFVVPLIVQRGLGIFATRHLHLHVGRAVVNVGAMVTLHVALSMTPLAVVAAISFTSPLWAVMGAILIFGEPAHRTRLLALAVGFAGTWIVLRPGIEVISEGALWMLASAAVWSGVVLFTKGITRHDDSAAVVVWMGVLVTAMTAVPAMLVWVAPTPAQLMWLVLVGFCHCGAQFCLSQALKMADAGVVMPVEFVKLLWAVVFGLAIFGEVPDLWTLVGAAVIFGAVIWLTMRESRRG